MTAGLTTFTLVSNFIHRSGNAGFVLIIRTQVNHSTCLVIMALSLINTNNISRSSMLLLPTLSYKLIDNH